MTIPLPPVGIWSSARGVYIRCGGILRMRPQDTYTGPMHVVLLEPIKDSKVTHGSPSNPDRLEIPMPIWNLGHKKPGGIDYVEGAMVHAQLLSRQGMAQGKSYDQMDEAAIATMRDMGATMHSIRARTWSIPIDEETQHRILQVIIGLQQTLPTETAAAAFLCDVFDNKLTITGRGLPDGLSRLPAASDKLVRAMTWIEFVRQSGPNSKPNFFDIYKDMERKITPELFISLGVDRKQIERAVAIGNGFDLIVVAAIARWVREMQRSIYENQPARVSSDWTFEHSSAVTRLTDMLGTYGIREIDDASLRKVNEGYLAAAIGRLASYKKHMQKRLAKAKRLN